MEKTEKVVGTICSKTTCVTYYVKWKLHDLTTWISSDEKFWNIACTDVKNEEGALKCAQRYIDGQPDIY